MKCLNKEGLNEHRYVTLNQWGGIIVIRIIINCRSAEKKGYHSVENCDHLKIRNRNFGHLGKVFMSFHYYSLVFATTLFSDLLMFAIWIMLIRGTRWFLCGHFAGLSPGKKCNALQLSHAKMHTKGVARGTEQHQDGKQDGRYFSKTLHFGESLVRIYEI